MIHQPIAEQIKNHAIAIISLIIAITALSYSTWREEVTEKNRNTRVAAFEVLKNLGQLQVVINAVHYAPDHAISNPMSNPMLGWGYIALISDLSELLPSPIPETTRKLTETWGESWSQIKTDEETTKRLSNEIDTSRDAILKVLKNLR